MDEGDLFGIRAIESGYYGGVAQSRPTSVVGLHTPSGSIISNTFLGIHSSPNLLATSPMSSVTSLSLGQNHKSPHEASRIITSQKHVPRPIKSGLQPSEAELNGRINHEPSINMSLELPPSPLSTTRSSTSWSSGGSLPRASTGRQTISNAGNRSPSPTYASPSEHGQYNQPPTSSALLHSPREGQGFAQSVCPLERVKYPVHSQSASIMSKSSEQSYFDSFRSPEEYSELPTRPPRAAHIDHSPQQSFYFPPRSSSITRGAPVSTTLHRHDQGKSRASDFLMSEDSRIAKPSLPNLYKFNG